MIGWIKLATQDGRTVGLPRGLLRFLVLNMLHEKSLSGTEIVKIIENQTEGNWKPSPGSIYPLLAWLSKKGFTKSPKYDPKEPPMKDLAKAFDITGDPETAGVMRDTMRTPPKPTDKDRGDVMEAKLRNKIARIRKAGEQIDP